MISASTRFTDPAYPSTLRQYLNDRAPKSIFAFGNFDILEQKLLALFCSVKCPGNLILKTYDLARALRDAGVTVISGFHSPMEKECLFLLLRGKQPIVWCLARRLATRGMPKECVGPLAEGRLLILSPFGENVPRATEETAIFRNEFVAALAERIFVAHAVQGSKTEALCRKVFEWHKPLLTFNDLANAALLDSGASTLGLEYREVRRSNNKRSE